jgi:hypothetical protein
VAISAFGSVASAGAFHGDRDGADVSAVTGAWRKLHLVIEERSSCGGEIPTALEIVADSVKLRIRVTRQRCYAGNYVTVLM